MKKICVAGLAMALMLGGVASSVSAAPYVSGSFGLVSVQDSTFSGPGGSTEVSTDPGFGFLAAIGNNFDGLRAEAEMAYRTNDQDASSSPLNDEITSLALMGNLLVDLPISESVRPFLGAGIGLANIDSDISGASNADDTVFAYQVIAGVGFPLTHITTLDFQYRYFASEDPDFGNVEAEYQSHNFFAGLRFDF